MTQWVPLVTVVVNLIWFSIDRLYFQGLWEWLLLVIMGSARFKARFSIVSQRCNRKLLIEGTFLWSESNYFFKWMNCFIISNFFQMHICGDSLAWKMIHIVMGLIISLKIQWYVFWLFNYKQIHEYFTIILYWFLTQHGMPTGHAYFDSTEFDSDWDTSESILPILNNS